MHKSSFQAMSCYDGTIPDDGLTLAGPISTSPYKAGSKGRVAVYYIINSKVGDVTDIDVYGFNLINSIYAKRRI